MTVHGLVRQALLPALLVLAVVGAVQAQSAHGNAHAGPLEGAAAGEHAHPGMTPAPPAGAGAAGGATDAKSPYAGEEVRALKALAPADVAALLKGMGMGLAKVAELNRYPGPRHVLDLAAGLKLTPGQRAATETVFATMRSQAQDLGHMIVQAERDLESAFVGGRIDPVQLARMTAEIGRLQGELRNAHLRAHLELKRLLTDEQVQTYDRLRGYGPR